MKYCTAFNYLSLARAVDNWKKLLEINLSMKIQSKLRYASISIENYLLQVWLDTVSWIWFGVLDDIEYLVLIFVFICWTAYWFFIHTDWNILWIRKIRPFGITLGLRHNKKQCFDWTSPLAANGQQPVIVIFKKSINIKFVIVEVRLRCMPQEITETRETCVSRSNINQSESPTFIIFARNGVSWCGSASYLHAAFAFN